MLLPVLAGLGALSLMSNPRRRRRKARRRNPSTPGGTDSRGTRYKLRKNTETAEWMLVAYVNGKRHEGRTLYFPFDRYDRASVAEARKDAENTLAHVTGARSNPRRRGRRNPLDADTIRRVHTRYYVLTNDLYHSQVKDADLAAYIAKAADRWANAHRASDRRVAPYLRELVTELTKTNPRRRGRRNPGTISRTSLTDAEAAIGGKALLGSKRSGAWAMSHASAKTFANRLRHGFKVVPSGHTGHIGEKLYLVTDGHWYVG